MATELILTDDVVGLGDIGERVRVKGGYARNFLIPRGLAFEVGSASARSIQHRMKQVEAKKKQLKSAAEGRASDMRQIQLELGLRVGEGGKVFGAITTRTLAQKLSEQGFTVDRRRIGLSEPIRKPGIHFVAIKLHSEVEVQLKVEVKEERATENEQQVEVLEMVDRLEESELDDNSLADEFDEEDDLDLPK